MSTVPLSRGDEARAIQRFGRAPRTDAVPVLPPDASDDAWKAARRKGIGASEMSVLLDVSPHNSRFALWWQKSQGWDIDESLGMRIGTRLEPVIRECFLDRFPDALLLRAGGRLWAHPSFPYMLCTPDYLAVFPDDPTRVIPVECKSDESGRAAGWGKDGTSEVPVHHGIQATVQACVFGADRAYVAHLRGKHFDVHPIEVGAQERVTFVHWAATASRFLASLETGVAPAVDAHEATATTLTRLYPSVDDDASPAVLDASLAAQYRDVRRRLTDLERHYRELQNRVRWEMRDAKEAVDPDGVLVAKRLQYKRMAYEAPTIEIDQLRPA